jgi:hypothetical protein
MNRSGGGGPFAHDPLAAVLGDRDKRAAVAQLLGHAYLTAQVLVDRNREQVEAIAEILVKRRELHGDEVVEVLEGAGLVRPEIDLLDERIWPPL